MILRNLRYLPWILAVMWFAARLLSRQFLGLENAKNFGVMSNMLLILILIFLTIYMRYRSLTGEIPGFMSDMKECMKSALKYVLAVTLAIGIYYGFFSNDLEEVRTAYIQTFNEQIQQAENLSKFRSEHTEYATSTVEEIMAANKENVERNVSVQARVLGALLALTIVSTVYSLLAVFFWRTVVKRL